MRNIGQEEAKNIIIEGYINILKRWPDENGMTHYLEELMSDKLNTEQFYNILINSEEYKERFGSSSISNINFLNKINTDKLENIKKSPETNESAKIDNALETNKSIKIDINKTMKTNSSQQFISRTNIDKNNKK